jgi:hypothetical protein
MDSKDFSATIPGNNFHYGMDTKKTAHTLRNLANQLESGSIGLQSCRVVSTAKTDDFSFMALHVIFAVGDNKR